MLRTFAALAIVLATDQAAIAQPTSVTFSRRAPAVGDQAEQTITVDFKLKTTTRSGAEVLQEADAHLQRNHQRVVTTTSVAKPSGKNEPHTATVEYRVAQRSLNGSEPQQEPVVGKTYHCARVGEELQITTPEGDLPPLAEYQIVATNMETLGRKNPLAEYFDGRTVNVGERIELPIELAAKLLGFEKKFASAKRFTLTLSRIGDLDGKTCAVFRTEIEAGSGATGQMGLIVEGPLVMQVAGCRAVSAEFSGPIAMTETQTAGPGQRVQVTGMGKLRVAIKTRYREAR